MKLVGVKRVAVACGGHGAWRRGGVQSRNVLVPLRRSWRGWSPYVIPRPHGDLEEVFPDQLQSDSNAFDGRPDKTRAASPSGMNTHHCLMVRRFKPTTQRAIHGGGYEETGSRHQDNRMYRRHQGLAHDKLLMVEMIDAGATPRRAVCRRYRQYRGGNRRWVLLVSGSSARRAHRSELSPRRLCVGGIVDEVVRLAGKWFSINRTEHHESTQDIEQVVKRYC